jgi:hypothetical protein
LSHAFSVHPWLVLSLPCPWNCRLLSLCRLSLSFLCSASANTSVEEIRERLTKYIDSVFPVIFYPGHLLLRLKDEIRRNHRYLMMFMLMEGELEGKKRLVNGIQLLTIQSALMFLLALLYDLQQPTGKRMGVVSS